MSALENRLLGALVVMLNQYAKDSHGTLNAVAATRASERALQVLGTLGLVSELGGGAYRWTQVQTEVPPAPKLASASTGKPDAVEVKSVAALTEQERDLLEALVLMAIQYLEDGHRNLDHEFMGAGEGTVAVLSDLGLVSPTIEYKCRWNDAGWKFLREISTPATSSKTKS